MRVPRTFSGPVQLLGLGLESVVGVRPLVALPPEPGLPRLFADEFPRACYHYFDYAAYRADQGADGDDPARFAFSHRVPPPPEPFDLAAIFFPKGRELAAYALGEIAGALGPGSPVLVVGDNRGGIRSSRALVEAAIGPVTETRSARHSVLYRAERSTVTAPHDGKKSFTIQAWGRSVTVITLPGVFSHGALDEGTRYLLETLNPTPAFRRALDWGCGGGAIGAALQLARPDAHVELVDADAMALAAARETLTANALDPERVRASDGFSGVRGSYDLIVANPPFHAGIRSALAVTERMLAESARFLLPGGKLVFVANIHHDFRGVLSRNFTHVRVLGENRIFRVVEAF